MTGHDWSLQSYVNMLYNLKSIFAWIQYSDIFLAHRGQQWLIKLVQGQTIKKKGKKSAGASEQIWFYHLWVRVYICSFFFAMDSIK